jgi:hypothetical protein
MGVPLSNMAAIQRVFETAPAGLSDFTSLRCLSMSVRTTLSASDPWSKSLSRLQYTEHSRGSTRNPAMVTKDLWQDLVDLSVSSVYFMPEETECRWKNTTFGTESAE